MPVISPDGRYLLFASTACNLLLTTNGSPIEAPAIPTFNVYLRDRTNGTTVLVSANLAGTGGGNGDSIPVGLSTNGHYAVFESSASDLVAGDTNGVSDVFVRDLRIRHNHPRKREHERRRREWCFTERGDDT